MIPYLFFCIFSGITEALFWSNYRGENPKFSWENVHLWMTLQRLVVWSYVSLYLGIYDTLGLVLMFPFLHDGAYYQTRFFIDGKYRGFFDTSTTSTAFMTFNFMTRTVLLAVGILTIALPLEQWL